MTEGVLSPLVAIGGREGIARIVERFYEKVEADIDLRPVYPENLEPGKEKLKLFLVQWLGGPAVYSEKYGHPRLRMRHFPFVIDEKAAGRWLRHMRESWREAMVPEDVQAMVFERLGPLAKHMINANDNVSRAPIGDVRLS